MGKNATLNNSSITVMYQHEYHNRYTKMLKIQFVKKITILPNNLKFPENQYE